MSALGVERPTVVPRVTGYVQRIIDFIQRLEQDGFAYARAGSVYFDTTAFEAQEGQNYGVMGGFGGGRNISNSSNSSSSNDSSSNISVTTKTTNSSNGNNGRLCLLYTSLPYVTTREN